MIKKPNFEQKVAECVGLWLAEGSNKSRSEITFTSSCLGLVNLFKRTMNKLFDGYRYNQRIYVYSKTKEHVDLPYEDCAIKNYVHKKATKPFFIFRIASVELTKKWRCLVERYLSEKKFYPYIFRGFFAGEGNIKEASHNSRVLRIAQKEQKEFINLILDSLGISYSFKPKNRSYEIHSKSMWDLFAKLKLADLHPDKKRKFWEVYSHFQEEHYPRNFLRNKLLSALNKPLINRQAAEIFKRSPARITEVLVDLKKEKKIKNFRIRSIDYWTNDFNLLLISSLKQEYIDFLEGSKPTFEFAKYFKVEWKSSFRRLKELEKLNIVKRQENGEWIKIKTPKKIVAI